MKATFKIWKTNRNLILVFLDNYTLEQLNTIPEGWSNNLFWNLAHCIAVQQLLVYKSSNLEGYVSDEFIAIYKHGTKPTGKTSEEEVSELKVLLISLIEKTESDFNSGKF